MSSKSHTHKRCGTLRKKSFSARGYAEIHIQRPFFDNRNFYFWKILKSQFLVEFQSFILWQFWAEFAALTVAESMPKERLKS
jgi:hypothetical protein